MCLARLHPAAGSFRGSNPRRALGFTLVELMIASTVTLMVVGAVLLTQVVGMRIFEATNSKMEISQEARRAMNMFMDDVRSARRVRVGIQFRTTFIEATGTNPRRGNAVMLNLDTNNSVYVRYDVDSATRTLRRSTNVTQFRTLSSGITNYYAFQMEDFRGNVLTQSVSRLLVALDLGYDPATLSSLRLGTNTYYNAHRVRAKVAHREVN